SLTHGLSSIALSESGNSSCFRNVMNLIFVYRAPFTFLTKARSETERLIFLFLSSVLCIFLHKNSE
ncbi:MAG: hypothetical protein K5648_10050, partial [Erysipelotrichaceae bacterium]|nr:hypothetical protein [Erysipelotrichaceae bacterium]